MTCQHCKGGLVCENHPERAYPDECECGAGMPCPVCTPATLRMTTEEALRAVSVKRSAEAMAKAVRRAVELTMSAANSPTPMTSASTRLRASLENLV